MCIIKEQTAFWLIHGAAFPWGVMYTLPLGEGPGRDQRRANETANLVGVLESQEGLCHRAKETLPGKCHKGPRTSSSSPLPLSLPRLLPPQKVISSFRHILLKSQLLKKLSFLPRLRACHSEVMCKAGDNQVELSDSPQKMAPCMAVMLSESVPQ